MFPSSSLEAVFFACWFWFGSFCAFGKSWEEGVCLVLFFTAVGFAGTPLTGSAYCLESSCCADPRVVALQSWGLKSTSLSRWAAVTAAPQAPRALREAMTIAPAVGARTVALHLPRSLHTSSPTAAGQPLPTAPAGHRGAASSWTPSVSLLSLFWLRARWHVKLDVQLLLLLHQDL